MGWQREQLAAAVPDLSDDEAIVDRWRANHTRGHVAVGGHLWLTTRRLVFVPNSFESVTGRSVWTCPLAHVTDVGVAPRGFSPFSGAWRRRLAVRTAAGSELFVVNRVMAVADAIRGEVGRA